MASKLRNFFHRAKKSAATEEKSSAAAYENDGHILRSFRKDNHTLPKGNHISYRNGKDSPTSHPNGNNALNEKIAPSYQKEGHKSYRSEG